jgi:hypothetical protein
MHFWYAYSLLIRFHVLSTPSEGLREGQGLVGEDLLFERGVRSVIIPVTKKRQYDQKRDEDSIPMKI